MDASGSPQTFRPVNQRPSSPPATPSSHSHSRFPSTASHTSPNFKRMGVSGLALSPPSDHIEPLGVGHGFRYTRPQSRSSRPSSASGAAGAPSPDRSFGEVESLEEDDTEMKTRRQGRIIQGGDLEVEEVEEDDMIYYSDSEVKRPDQFEDARSDKATESKVEDDIGIVNKFKRLQCDEPSDPEEEEEQLRRYRMKKKRWSAGHYKRSHSQSVGSDSDIEDPDAMDAHDVGATARRMRRRTRGPSDRGSINFGELLSSRPVVEVEEPPDSDVDGGQPPSIPSDDGFTLDSLPFYPLEGPMDVDSGASRPSTPA